MVNFHRFLRLLHELSFGRRFYPLPDSHTSLHTSDEYLMSPGPAATTLHVSFDDGAVSTGAFLSSEDSTPPKKPGHSPESDDKEPKSPRKVNRRQDSIDVKRHRFLEMTKRCNFFGCDLNPQTAFACLETVQAHHVVSCSETYDRL